MGVAHRVFLLVLFLSFPDVIATNNCHNYYDHYTQVSFKLFSPITKTVFSSSTEDCLSKCSSSMVECQSINYQHTENKCEFNKGSHLTDPAALQPADGYTYVKDRSQVSVSSNRCSDKYCSESLYCVLDDVDDYLCKPCEEAGLKNMLVFSRRSTDDKVEWDNPFDARLSAFTVAVWVNGKSGFDYQAVFSYAVENSVNNFNDIFIEPTDTGTIVLIGNNRWEPAGPYMNGHWQHIALTWESSTGKTILYINGTKKNETTLHTGKTFGKGVIVIGQDQDAYKGGYEPEQTFQGKLTKMDMWSKVLSDVEIQTMQNSSVCASTNGNLVKWSNLPKKAVFGEIKMDCVSKCV